MKRNLTTALLAFSLLSVSANDNTTTNNPDTMTTSKDQQAIEQVIHAYGAAVKTGDASKVMPLFTADGVFMPLGFPTSVGKDQVQAAYTGVFGMIALDLTFTIDEVVVEGDLAFVRSTSSGTATVLANKTTNPDSYRELFVLRRENGTWRIARYIYNKVG